MADKYFSIDTFHVLGPKVAENPKFGLSYKLERSGQWRLAQSERIGGSEKCDMEKRIQHIKASTHPRIHMGSNLTDQGEASSYARVSLWDCAVQRINRWHLEYSRRGGAFGHGRSRMRSGVDDQRKSRWRDDDLERERERERDVQMKVEKWEDLVLWLA
ncbi:hypothetical protein L1887_10832 [Cichorium endivia]|nr:hypothetical protein L1887_10832 [Cichorium endivia]